MFKHIILSLLICSCCVERSFSMDSRFVTPKKESQHLRATSEKVTAEENHTLTELSYRLALWARQDSKAEYEATHFLTYLIELAADPNCKILKSDIDEINFISTGYKIEFYTNLTYAIAIAVRKADFSKDTPSYQRFIQENTRKQERRADVNQEQLHSLIGTMNTIQIQMERIDDSRNKLQFRSYAEFKEVVGPIIDEMPVMASNVRRGDGELRPDLSALRAQNHQQLIEIEQIFRKIEQTPRRPTSARKQYSGERTNDITRINLIGEY